MSYSGRMEVFKTENRSKLDETSDPSLQEPSRSSSLDLPDLQNARSRDHYCSADDKSAFMSQEKCVSENASHSTRKDLNDDELLGLGQELTQARCGGYVKIGEAASDVIVYFAKPPTSSHLACVQPNIVVPFYSMTLRTLCELTNLNTGISCSWNCKSKDLGRLYARCSLSGVAVQSRGKGIRTIMSKKVGCPASVTTISLEKYLSNLETDMDASEIASAINTQATELMDVNGKKSAAMSFCVIRSSSTEHDGHECDSSSPENMLLCRTFDVLAVPELRSALETFIQISPRGRGFTTKAFNYLKEAFPHISIPIDTVRNVIANISFDEKDASDLVSFLRLQKASGALEFLQVVLDDETGVLRCVTWSYAGSREVVRRCGDLLFWDSTHNMTRYAYKLASFTVVDSEGCSRAVLLSLNLEEAAEDC